MCACIARAGCRQACADLQRGEAARDLSAFVGSVVGAHGGHDAQLGGMGAGLGVSIGVIGDGALVGRGWYREAERWRASSSWAGARDGWSKEGRRGRHVWLWLRRRAGVGRLHLRSLVPQKHAWRSGCRMAAGSSGEGFDRGESESERVLVQLGEGAASRARGQGRSSQPAWVCGNNEGKWRATAAAAAAAVGDEGGLG